MLSVWIYEPYPLIAATGNGKQPESGSAPRLPGKRSLDHKTIAEFRRQNGEGLKQVFQGLVKLCVRLGLYGKASKGCASRCTKESRGRWHEVPMAESAFSTSYTEEGLSVKQVRIQGKRTKGKGRVCIDVSCLSHETGNHYTGGGKPAESLHLMRRGGV